MAKFKFLKGILNVTGNHPLSNHPKKILTALTPIN